MKAKTKFLKMYYKMPEECRKELVYAPYSLNPMTLNVIAIEVRNNTPLSLLILDNLGYKNDN